MNVTRTSRAVGRADSGSCAAARLKTIASPAAAAMRLRIVPPVHLSEQVIAPLTVLQERHIDVLRAHLIIKPRKAQDVILGSKPDDIPYDSDTDLRQVPITDEDE